MPRKYTCPTDAVYLVLRGLGLFAGCMFLYLKMYEQTKPNRRYTSEDLCYMGAQKVSQLRIKWEEGWCSYTQHCSYGSSFHIKGQFTKEYI